MPQFSLPFFGHGGDYNPDQWRHIPGTFEEDLRLMKLSHCNLMSVGIFSWAALEPREGEYDFDWLSDVLDGLHANGVSVFLATPSGARPAWMDEKYEEVRRVDACGARAYHGERHNHCYTSPAYRALTRRMNVALAERFGRHPAVAGWHISNEYGGECHCPLCQEAFRAWLKAKYHDSLDELNHAWWTGFWSKTYTDWSQLRSPSPIGETAVHGLTLDWKRFVTAQTVDFMNAEVAPLRQIAPDLPVTTNMMGTYPGLDYFRFRDSIDFASYDSYPLWGGGDDEQTAVEAGFAYDITRSILRKPWALMESTPSMTNWQNICKPKRPGMHLLSSMQAVAHGADTVQYFQWRKSRGACEKLHGAVVGHDGTENTRVFREVTQVGEWLQSMTGVLHAETRAEVAVLFDWNNRWAIEDAKGPRRDKRHDAIVMEHYKALIRQGIDADVIDMEQDFSPYRVLVAPMLYMIKPGVAERMERFAQNGGTLVATYWTGIVDENDLCFLGGFPGPLRKLLGVWSEEIDALYDGQHNRVSFREGNALAMQGHVRCDFLCDVCHAETASVEATYDDDYYAGLPALTRNPFGEGEAWYIAAHTDADALEALYGKLLRRAGVTPPVKKLPHGVQINRRYASDGTEYLFALNFSGAEKHVRLPDGVNIITGAPVSGKTALKINETLILRVSP